MFEKNIPKFLSKYRDIFGISVELEWCRWRRKNRYVLKINAGTMNKSLYFAILGFAKECVNFNFKRVEFINVFESDAEYYILKLKNDTKNKRIIGDKDLIIGFI